MDDALLQYLSPLGWEHINLTGDYLWRSSAKVGAGQVQAATAMQPALAYDFFRFLRRPQAALREIEKITRELRESEPMFRSLVNQSLLGIAIIEHGRFTFTNQPLQRHVRVFR